MNEILKILLEISKQKQLEYVLINYSISSPNYCELTAETNEMEIREYVDKRLIRNEQYQASLYNKLMEGLNNVEEV